MHSSTPSRSKPPKSDDIHTSYLRCTMIFDYVLHDLEQLDENQCLPFSQTVRFRKDQLETWAMQFGADMPSSSFLSLDSKLRNHQANKDHTIISLQNLREDLDCLAEVVIERKNNPISQRPQSAEERTRLGGPAKAYLDMVGRMLETIFAWRPFVKSLPKTVRFAPPDSSSGQPET